MGDGARDVVVLLYGETQKCALMLPRRLQDEVDKHAKQLGLKGVNQATRLLWWLFLNDQIGVDFKALAGDLSRKGTRSR